MSKISTATLTILTQVWSIWIILCAWHPDFSVSNWEYVVAWLFAALFIGTGLLTTLNILMVSWSSADIESGSANRNKIRRIWLEVCRRRHPIWRIIAPWRVLVTIATIVSMAEMGWTVVAILTGIAYAIGKFMSTVCNAAIRDLRTNAVKAKMMTWEELGYPPSGPA